MSSEALILEVLLRGSIVLAAALALARVERVAVAARQAALVTALAAVALLPLQLRWGPRLRLPVGPARAVSAEPPAGAQILIGGAAGVAPVSALRRATSPARPAGVGTIRRGAHDLAGRVLLPVYGLGVLVLLLLRLL